MRHHCLEAVKFIRFILTKSLATSATVLHQARLSIISTKMFILPLGVLLLLAVTKLSFSSPTQPLGIVPKTRGSGLNITTLADTIIKSDHPIRSTGSVIASSGATEDLSILMPDNLKVPLHPSARPEVWPGKASARGPSQRGAALPQLFRAAVEACWQVLGYYERNAESMNLDALLGTRLAEGEFYLSLRDLAARREGRLKGAGAAMRVRRLHSAANVVGNAVEDHLRRTDREYDDLSSILERNFWRVSVAVSPLPTDTHPPERVLSGHEELTPDQTDICLEQVGNSRGCHVSKSCWDLLATKVYSGYSLTHQVLYLLTGMRTECRDKMNELAVKEGFKGGVGDILARMCSAVLADARGISEAGFPESFRDLFSEQGALCGLLGYHDFFPEAWVRRVLSWQRQEGCFGDIKILQKALAGPVQHPPHRRVRREEIVMTDGCLAHRSAVALGYLAVYIHHTIANAFNYTTRSF